MRTLASLLLFAGLLLSQPTSSRKPGTIEGVVVSSVTGDPIKKANVTLAKRGMDTTYAAATDSTGRFRFDSVEPDFYQAIAVRDGYSRDRNAGSKPFTLAEEQHVTDLAIKLTPLAVVNGHVLDEDGDPMTRAQVQALRYIYRRGEVRQLNPAGYATTNDLGEFQILDLEPGQYYFLAAAPPRLPRLPLRTRSTTPELTYPDTLYPSALHAEQATASQLAPGAQLTNIDIRMQKVAAFHVRGKAIDSRTGQPAREAMVSVQSLESVFFARAQVAMDGTFDARGVISGPHILHGRAAVDLTAQVAVHVGDHDVDDVVLSLRPLLDISGTVQVEGAPPQQKRTIEVGFNAITMGPSESVEVTPDGSFALKVMPAMYRIIVACDSGAYLKSMRFGDQDVTSGRIDLTQQSGGTLKIVCGVDVGKLQGSVQNGNGDPAPGALIAICPDSANPDRQDLFYAQRSDPNGKFNFPGLAPGEYKAFAWQSEDDNMVLSTELRKAFDGRGVPVSISPGASASVQLNLIPATEIDAERNKVP